MHIGFVNCKIIRLYKLVTPFGEVRKFKVCGFIPLEHKSDCLFTDGLSRN